MELDFQNEFLMAKKEIEIENNSGYYYPEDPHIPNNTNTNMGLFY